MRKIFFALFLIGICSCSKNTIEKPKNLIPKDKMISILYDVSLLEAVKTQNINGGISSKNINKFIFNKYKIDSIQFKENNHYYASDIEEYKKMFEEIKARMEEDNKKLGGNSTLNSNTPQVQ
jgi:hypothetical protein